MKIKTLVNLKDEYERRQKLIDELRKAVYDSNKYKNYNEANPKHYERSRYADITIDLLKKEDGMMKKSYISISGDTAISIINDIYLLIENKIKELEEWQEKMEI